MCNRLHLHFNSIKVRLKHDSDFASQVLAHLFQFHKGTIKTDLSLSDWSMST